MSAHRFDPTEAETKAWEEFRNHMHRDGFIEILRAGRNEALEHLVAARRECEGLRDVLRESRRHIVAARRFAGLSEDGPEVRRIDAALAAPAAGDSK